MIFFKKKPALPIDQRDHLAKIIADRIIGWQILLATTLNARVNKCSKKRQKRFFWVCFSVITGGLILSLGLSSRKIGTITHAPNDQPVHIGMPSDPPVNRQVLPTDSLTLKK
ncbi:MULTISPECIES: hypothetical protein [unclassified Mucilaginibacter]|uniref:hypothetical protein n=1 Tax=unclassified Mucilaginibacter TaxID=2617802 RepID=UPI00088A2597|nr:hypothetical protein [Mucilaginibacter sp. OK268]SDP13937.1 hypothetical protein SAMN05428975_0447 [Mucilaginibacter sp. OK268]